jgi:hypothetical protein
MAHVVKYAESGDGISWRREGATAISLASGAEIAVARPCVLRDPGLYRMWYCYRGDYYRIGYAESNDGRRWTRLDERAGIQVSESGWDSEAICYPSVFDAEGRRYMLYNGNRYGLSGFGIAILESD